MTDLLKILIVDPDRFFVAGLQQIIKEHFDAKGISVVFMSQQLSYPIADLIFWAPGYPTTVMPIGLLAGRIHTSQLIMIMSQQSTHLVKNYLPWILYRHQDQSTLLSLIDRVLISKAISKNKKNADKRHDSPLTSLSPRQREVIRQVSKGMCPREIADDLKIHVKTVSHHKRTAMGKLQLSRTTDLYHWLLNNSMTNILEG